MKTASYDIVIVGSGAGGGTVAQELSPLCKRGARIAVLEKGPKLRPQEFTGKELEMFQALYEQGGGFLTADRTMSLAMGSTYGGSTTVYTGTSLLPPERVISRWNIPGLSVADLHQRARKFSLQNNVHPLDAGSINQNNHLFVEGCKRLGYNARQFPINVKSCRGSSLCNLGCPNQAKQGTNQVQLPKAESNGVDVITRCEVLRIDEHSLSVRVSNKPEGAKGEPSAWQAGEYTIQANIIIVCAGAVHSPALLLRSGLGNRLPQLGKRFTCHPALIMVAEHESPITNFVGHPKSFFLDQFAATESFVLETCMYFPFITAKSISGFGKDHSAFMEAFPRLQMILVLACDDASEENRVTIDRKGAPVVHYGFSRQTCRGLIRGAATSLKIFFAAGGLRAHFPVGKNSTVAATTPEKVDELATSARFLPGRTTVSAAHLQGGCAMGSWAADSVTDSRGRVHGHRNLFVADASLFPNALEINPYLTIMALADRVAETIREEAGTLL